MYHPVNKLRISMISVILVGHGRFGTGLGAAVEQVIGPQENFIKIDFPEGVSVPELKEEMIKVFDELYNEDGVVFLCDLLGGSPFRTASSIAIEHKNVEVIAGTNMQMCAEMMLERDEFTLEQFREQALTVGCRGITSLHTEWSNQKKEQETENAFGI